MRCSLDNVYNAYTSWRYSKIECPQLNISAFSFSNILELLANTEYFPTMSLDANRADDGLNLVRTFYYETTGSIHGPWYPPGCSMLDMMLALAIRAEDTMGDMDLGDRVGVWFWRMVDSLGLLIPDIKYTTDEYPKLVLDRFMRSDYNPDGRGGLFTLPGCPVDLRKIEIWDQMSWYLDRVIDSER